VLKSNTRIFVLKSFTRIFVLMSSTRIRPFVGFFVAHLRSFTHNSSRNVVGKFSFHTLQNPQNQNQCSFQGESLKSTF
jgi:hypothetical protein